MPEKFKFPKGFEVTVVRKEDIIACIDHNIIDKEVALEVIKRCECDAANFIKEGRWTGIPFMGNIRIPKVRQKFISKEVQEVLSEAKQVLDNRKYILFRKSMVADLGKQVKAERYYKYVVSRFAGKNPKFFKAMNAAYGEAGARFICYTLTNLELL